MSQDIVDQPAQKRDVGSRPERNVQVRDGRRARKARIDMDDFAAVFFGFHGPAEADRMRFGHVGTHD